MPYVDLAGLSRFAGKSKDFASSECAGLDMANWQRTAAAGAVSFSPVPEMPLDPVVNFLFTETGPASGTKAPDNPSTITGVSEVKVTRCGKNLIYYPYESQSGTTNGVSFTVNDDETVLVNGTASSVANFKLDNFLNFKKGVSYCFSGCPAAGSSYGINIDLRTKRSHGQYINTLVETGSGNTFIPSSDCYGAIYINIRSGATVSNLVFKPQLELGSAATSFEPYEGADYTLPLGGTFYGGSVDLSTGVMTVTHVGYVLSSELGLYPTSLTYTYRTNVLGSTTSDNPATAACSHYQKANTATLADMPVNSMFFRNDGMLIVKTDGLSLQQFKDFADAQISNGTPIVATYPLKSPYTVTLTPTQIYSLSQIDPYNPRTNTVYSDQVSVQAGYPKSPQAAQNELTNAVVSLGGNL